MDDFHALLTYCAAGVIALIVALCRSTIANVPPTVRLRILDAIICAAGAVAVCIVAGNHFPELFTHGDGVAVASHSGTSAQAGCLISLFPSRGRNWEAVSHDEGGPALWLRGADLRRVCMAWLRMALFCAGHSVLCRACGQQAEKQMQGGEQ